MFSRTWVGKLALQSASGEAPAQPLGEAQAEAFEQGGLGAIGAYDAAQAQLALRGGGGRQHDVGAVDGGEFLEDGARTVAEAGAALPLLEGLPQNVGKKADQDMGQHAILALMPDGSDRQLALGDAERCFGFAELDVGSPQRLGRPVLDVGAQHVTAFAVARPVVPFGPDRPVEAQPGGRGGIFDQADRIASGGARVAAEQPSDLTLGGAAIDRAAGPREPSAEASQSGLDALAEAGMHGAFLQLALGRAHQQEGLAALGAGTQLGLDPSRTWRQSRASTSCGASVFNSLLFAPIRYCRLPLCSQATVSALVMPRSITQTRCAWP